MNISLIDFDKTNFPNLALMKISAYHKSKGNNVKWHEPLFDKPDIIYCSKVFKSAKVNLPTNENICLGGTGFDINRKLPDEIEHICPDYSLYGLDYSMGFITRGCVRLCPFCIVPKKEGEIYFNAHIKEFQKHKKVVLLDNNILACNKGIDELENISRADTQIDINQGLDFRLVNPYIADLLSRLKWINGVIRTACDNDANFEALKNGVELLQMSGVKPYRIFCYCLVKSEKDVQRILEIDRLGVKPFAMPYMDYFNKTETPQICKDIARWCNHKAIFNAQKNFHFYKRSKTYA